MPAHRLPDRVIDGLEKRVLEQGGMAQPKHGSHLQELVELRALARDLIAHINAIEGVR